MKSLPDESIGDVRAIEIAGVDVIDAARHGLAQHGKCGTAILRRPEHTGSGELHGAVAHAVHAAVSQGENASSGNVGHGKPPELRTTECDGNGGMVRTTTISGAKA